MTNNSSFAKIVYLLALIATIIGFTAFSQKPGERNLPKKEQLSKDSNTSQFSKGFGNDGVPNLDRLDIELKQLDLHLDQLKEQMKNFDFSKTQKQLDAAMQKLDAQKISAEVNQSLKNIDWNKINKQVEESVAKLDKVKMVEVKKEIAKAKAELANEKVKIQFEKPRIDAEKIKAETKDAFENARKSIEKAKEDINNMKEFSKALQQDGLIDNNKQYKIEVKDGELYINGTKQSKEINDKYKKYYRKENFNFNFKND